MNYLTYSELIFGEYYRDWKRHKIPDNIRTDYTEAMRRFLLSHCRVGSRVYENIRCANLLAYKPVGIFNRLVYNLDRNEVEYIAGQDYPGEVRYIKNYIANHR